MSLNVQLIRESFENVKPIGDQVVSKFYEILFKNHPEATALFENVDFEKQRKALLASLVFVVEHIEDTEKLTDYLQNMGERHVKYGTKEEHFPWVGEALLSTFAHFFGDTWTPELEESWTSAYGVIREQMTIGMQRGQPEPATDEPKVVSLKSNVTSIVTLPDSVRVQIRMLVKEQIEAQVQKEVEEVYREELEKLSKDSIKSYMKSLKGAA